MAADRPKAKHPNYAFIDGQNLYMSIKNQGWALDYKRFRRYLTDKYIVSGDGDFYCLVNYLRNKGKLLKLMVPDNSRFSSLFRKFADDIVGINKLKDKLGCKK